VKKWFRKPSPKVNFRKVIVGPRCGELSGSGWNWESNFRKSTSSWVCFRKL